MTEAAAGGPARLARPVTALAVGVLAVAMLAATAMIGSVTHQLKLSSVDHRFNRARYDADQTVARFAARLQDAVDLGTVRSDLLGTGAWALQPAHITVWAAPARPAADHGTP